MKTQKMAIVFVIASMILAACGVRFGPPSLDEAKQVIVGATQTATAKVGELAGQAEQFGYVLVPAGVTPKASEVLPIATLSASATTQKLQDPQAADLSQNVGVDPLGTLATGKWSISYFPGVTDQMKSWTFKDLDPRLWQVFPNVDNAGYPAANGVEYGMAESMYCQQDQRCDFQVAARHYRLFTGDYKIDGIGECHEKDGVGCAVAVFNVGDVTSILTSQEMDDGFTVTGRYWNGDVLPHAVWALLSNAVSNMLNLNSPLNQNNGTNAGANCSVPGGCVGVDVTFAVTSGNQVLVIGHTLFSK
jgi:hypothetical protein